MTSTGTALPTLSLPPHISTGNRGCRFRSDVETARGRFVEATWSIITGPVPAVGSANNVWLCALPSDGAVVTPVGYGLERIAAECCSEWEGFCAPSAHLSRCHIRASHTGSLIIVYPPVSSSPLRSRPGIRMVVWRCMPLCDRSASRISLITHVQPIGLATL